MSIPGKDALSSLYRRRARFYDLTANLYYLIGFREFAYRSKAVESLMLKPGDTVVEIGCGTGLTFRLLQSRIGPGGRIIGVDLTDRMLDKAERRARDNNWNNIELVREDAARYRFPENISGILSTFAITLVPEFDEVIRRGSAALAPGGRLAILDFKLPANRLSVFAPVLAYITSPFGVSMELAERHPWESVEKHLDSISMEEYYGGYVYIATGQKSVSRLSD